MRRFALCALLTVLVAGCHKPGTTFEFTDPYAVDDFSIPGLTVDNFPFIDCSTSTSPLRDMVLFHLLGVKCYWGTDYISGSTYRLYFDLPAGMVPNSEEHVRFIDRLLELRASNGSHGAYVNLMDGVTDLIIDSRDISRNELKEAQEKGVEIETKPLAWDALVFIVNPVNRVRSLSREEIRDIYAGRITNWGEVGGAAQEIHPYMRDADSGSQEKMETMVMQGTPMVDLPEMVGSVMESPYISIERDNSGIGYTPYYYCERMVGDLRQVKVLAVDGVYPNAATILNGAAGRERDAYPYFSNIYAAIRKDEPADSYARRIYEWLSTPRAKDIVDESGYISMRSHRLAN